MSDPAQHQSAEECIHALYPVHVYHAEQKRLQQIGCPEPPECFFCIFHGQSAENQFLSNGSKADSGKDDQTIGADAGTLHHFVGVLDHLREQQAFDAGGAAAENRHENAQSQCHENRLRLQLLCGFSYGGAWFPEAEPIPERKDDGCQQVRQCRGGRNAAIDDAFIIRHDCLHVAVSTAEGNENHEEDHHKRSKDLYGEKTQYWQQGKEKVCHTSCPLLGRLCRREIGLLLIGVAVLWLSVRLLLVGVAVLWLSVRLLLVGVAVLWLSVRLLLIGVAVLWLSIRLLVGVAILRWLIWLLRSVIVLWLCLWIHDASFLCCGGCFYLYCSIFTAFRQGKSKNGNF